MKKSKLLNLFLIVTMLSVWSWPELSLAVEIDWFGNKNKDQIIYLKGYNAAMSKVAANLEIPKPTKRGAQPKTISTLTTTSSTAYVTNPMTTDLNTNGFHLGNYSDNNAIYLDTGLKTSKVCVTGNLNDPGACFEDPAILGRAANVGVYGVALNGSAGTGIEGQGFHGVTGSATGNNGAGIYGKVVGGIDNAYAGYFEGNVKIVNGNLKLDRISSNAEAVYFDNAVNFGNNQVYGRNLNFTTMENNQILLKGLALGSNSTAGHFSAFGSNSYALMASATTSNSYAGYFEGNVNATGLLKAAKLCVTDNLNDPGACFDDPAILGRAANVGVYGVALNGSAGAGVQGQGFYGVSGSTIGNNGAAIYGTVVGGVNDAYAGYFKGRVEIENSMLIVNNPYTYVTGTPPYFSSPDASVGIAVTGAEYGIAAWGMNSTSGAGVSGKGYHGLEGQAIFEGGAGLYASNSGLENTLAGYFDGKVKMVNGGLEIDHGSVKIESASNSQPALSARVLVDGATAINGVATTPNSLAGHFYGNVVVDAGKLGVGTATPNKQLHVYSQDANAEIDIQSGSNTHWGIYQDKSSGNLNFWNSDNKVTFSDKGVSAKGFCLEKVCIDSWKDLKAILDQTDPVPVNGNRVPTQQ